MLPQSGTNVVYTNLVAQVGLSVHQNHSCSHPTDKELFVRRCMGTRQLAPASLVRSLWRASRAPRHAPPRPRNNGRRARQTCRAPAWLWLVVRPLQVVRRRCIFPPPPRSLWRGGCQFKNGRIIVALVDARLSEPQAELVVPRMRKGIRVGVAEGECCQ